MSYVNLKNLVWLKNSRTGFRYAPFVEQRRDDKEAISNSWSELNYIYVVYIYVIFTNVQLFIGRLNQYILLFFSLR